MSDTRFTKDNEGKLESDSTILVNKLKTFDPEQGIWWFPAVVNMGKLGIIYPEGSTEKWEWKFAKTVPIPEDKKGSPPAADQVAGGTPTATSPSGTLRALCRSRLKVGSQSVGAWV